MRGGSVLAGPARGFSWSGQQEVPSPFPLPLPATFSYLLRLVQLRNSSGWGGADEASWSKGHSFGPHGPPSSLVFPRTAGKEKTTLFLARISLAREWTLDFLAGSDGA